jgi:peptide/nickel transport system ATP-binding protein
MSQLLRVEDLWVEGRPPGGEYETIVKGVNFTIASGEVLALIGESGSGKTTISLATLGYARPGCRISKGRIFLNGEDVLTFDQQGRRQLRGSKVAYVAQSAAAAFNPAMTLNRQVTEAPRVHGTMPVSKATERAIDLYRRLDLPDPESIGRRYPHQVSGGQLQRLMAAMALSCGPELLVLDEPTTALDVTTQIEVLKAFKEVIREQKTAAIYVTHDLAVVAQIADRIVVLYGGEVMEDGTADQIINRPTHEYTRTLMDAVRKPPKGEASDGQIIASDLAERSPSLLQIRDVTAAYGRVRKVTILRDINIAIDRKEVVGVIGESGCGKSTLARVISGLLPPVSGDVLLDGEKLPGDVRSRKREDLKRVQIVFQMADVALNPRQTVAKILGRPLKFYHGLDHAQRDERVGELLELVELPREFARRYPGELSGGQKQRVNLARALAAEPEIILCDEVTSALDTVVAAAVIELLKDLQEKLGVSYVFISHDLSTVAAFADRIVVLYAGRVVEQGPTANVLSPPYHPYTKLLLSSVPELRRGWLEDVMETREAISGIARGVEISDVGCPFYNRCPMAIDGVCDQQTPPIRNHVASHDIACHREIEELLETQRHHLKVFQDREQPEPEERQLVTTSNLSPSEWGAEGTHKSRSEDK